MVTFRTIRQVLGIYKHEATPLRQGYNLKPLIFQNDGRLLLKYVNLRQSIETSPLPGKI